MRWKFVAGILGAFTFVLGLVLALPMLVALIYRESCAGGFALSMLVATIVGGAVWLSFRRYREEINLKEGLFIVAGAWFFACLFGALPFYFCGVFDNFTDCFFETCSGFTTTGATVLTDIEAQQKGILFWRSFTHWLGGMGIIVLSIAILPLIGVGGMQLFRAEVPGPTADKIKPRIAETARILWLVYVGLSVFETLLLMLGGMDFFDALCHTFGTMATGGFSTKNASIGHYDSSYIHYVIAIFMFLAGVNFALHFAAVRGNFKAYLKDNEFRIYTSIIVVMTIMGSLVLIFQTDKSVSVSIRDTFFQIVAFITTTGYSTSDYELWPFGGQILLLILMFVGGSTGSTGGGVKVMRHVLMFKQAYNELYMLVHPHAVRVIKYGKTTVSPAVMRSIWSFLFLYLFLFALASIIMGMLGHDPLTATTTVASAIGNIGPGFGHIGPTENYAHFGVAAKWLLSMCMLIGRLEVYTVVILFAPAFWRK